MWGAPMPHMVQPPGGCAGTGSAAVSAAVAAASAAANRRRSMWDVPGPEGGEAQTEGSSTGAVQERRRHGFTDGPDEGVGTDAGCRGPHNSNSRVGTVKSYSETRGFGFVLHPEFNGDIWFARESVAPELRTSELAGTPMYFDLHHAPDGKPQARNLRPVSTPGFLQMASMNSQGPRPQYHHSPLVSAAHQTVHQGQMQGHPSTWAQQMPKTPGQTGGQIPVQMMQTGGMGMGAAMMNAYNPMMSQMGPYGMWGKGACMGGKPGCCMAGKGGFTGVASAGFPAFAGKGAGLVGAMIAGAKAAAIAPQPKKAPSPHAGSRAWMGLDPNKTATAPAKSRSRSESSSKSSSESRSRKKTKKKKKKGRKKSESSSSDSSSSSKRSRSRRRGEKDADTAEASAVLTTSTVSQKEIDLAKKDALDKLTALQTVEPKENRAKEFRLLLRTWHPDKNPDKMEIATAVFQFLQKGKKLLNLGS